MISVVVDDFSSFDDERCASQQNMSLKQEY
jgi:hypothetical protein